MSINPPERDTKERLQRIEDMLTRLTTQCLTCHDDYVKRQETALGITLGLQNQFTQMQDALQSSLSGIAVFNKQVENLKSDYGGRLDKIEELLRDDSKQHSAASEELGGPNPLG